MCPRRTRKKYNFSLWGFVSFLILSMGLVGISIASWQDGLTAESTVTIANIKAAFGHVQPVKTASSASALIRDNANTIYLEISNAAPGSSYSFYYTLANEGSIPVRFCTADSNYRSNEITVTNKLEQDLLDTNGGTIQGTINVSIGDVAEETDYNYRLPILYHHWNSSPEELSWHGYLYIEVDISTGKWLETTSFPASESSSEPGSAGSSDQEETPTEEAPPEENIEKDEEDSNDSKPDGESQAEASPGASNQEKEAEDSSAETETTGEHNTQGSTSPDNTDTSSNPETNTGGSNEESEESSSHDEADDATGNANDNEMYN